MASDNLQNAIDAAAAELIKDAEKATAGETQEEPEVEIEGEETPEETSEESTEEELSEAQLQESKNLYKALTGPQATAIIAALAQQAGILTPGQQPLTKNEETVARREIIDIVKEGLGPEYAFLSDRLGKIFDDVSAQQKAEYDSQIAEINQNRIETDVVKAYDKLAIETKGASKQLENRMAKLSGEVPIGQMNVETYMRRLYVIAAGEKGIKMVPPASSQKTADKIRANANDAHSRLRGTPANGSVNQNQIQLPKEKMNLDQSVKWAMDQLQKGNK